LGYSSFTECLTSSSFIIPESFWFIEYCFYSCLSLSSIFDSVDARHWDPYHSQVRLYGLETIVLKSVN
jgi:hypothetical protein